MELVTKNQKFIRILIALALWGLCTVGRGDAPTPRIHVDWADDKLIVKSPSDTGLHGKTIMDAFNELVRRAQLSPETRRDIANQVLVNFRYNQDPATTLKPMIETAMRVNANPPPQDLENRKNIATDLFDTLGQFISTARGVDRNNQPRGRQIEGVVTSLYREANPSPAPNPGNGTPSNPGNSPSAGNGKPQPGPSSSPGVTPEDLMRMEAVRDALARKRAAEDAEKSKGKGGGGSGSGGSGSGGGGSSGGGGDSGGVGSSGISPKTLADALKHVNQGKKNEPSLSDLRSMFPDRNNDRGAKDDDKKKDENKFSLPTKKLADKDFLGPKKDTKKEDPEASTSEVPTVLTQNASAGPTLSGNSSVPQSIAEQWGSGNSAGLNGSLLGGGDSGGTGFGGASVGGGAAGAGSSGSGGFGFNVGQGEPVNPEPPIKKFLQEVQSISAGSENEGSEEGEGSSNGDFTSKSSQKRGDGLLVNQIVLTMNNPKAKGRGIMAYVGATNDFCDGPQGKRMAVCHIRREKGELFRR